MPPGFPSIPGSHLKGERLVPLLLLRRPSLCGGIASLVEDGFGVMTALVSVSDADKGPPERQNLSMPQRLNLYRQYFPPVGGMTC